jgi:hypothetical protein
MTRKRDKLERIWKGCNFQAFAWRDLKNYKKPESKYL